MLINRIIGNCPSCGAIDSYGNVFVAGDFLLRGCIKCNKPHNIPLPKLSKEILYLDQFFLSHAFRGELPEFVEGSRVIERLARDHLMVCPYSDTHEVETHQWRHPHQNSLWEFIKHTAHGHSFMHEYRIKKTQIYRAFKRFLTNDKRPYETKYGDAFSKDINRWDDYIRIEIDRPHDDIERRRQAKKQAITQLVDIFPSWRKETTTFDEDRKDEMLAAARVYTNFYIKMAARIMAGDLGAHWDSPVDSGIVQILLHFDSEEMDIKERIIRIGHFFRSNFFNEIPYHFISSGLFAVLRQRVKNGYYLNVDKAKEKLSGFFYDVVFISAYTPYCNAIFIDNAMFDFVNDPRLDISGKYQTRFFCKNNWKEFTEYLKEVENRKSPEIATALDMIYPPRISKK